MNAAMEETVHVYGLMVVCLLSVFLSQPTLFIVVIIKQDRLKMTVNSKDSLLEYYQCLNNTMCVKRKINLVFVILQFLAKMCKCKTMGINDSYHTFYHSSSYRVFLSMIIITSFQYVCASRKFCLSADGSCI